jgi:hypothetical protein
MPLSKIFHVPVYHINQFYRLGNYGYLLKITGLPTVTDSLQAIFQLYHGDQVTVVVEKTGVSRENHSMSATHVSN